MVATGWRLGGGTSRSSAASRRAADRVPAVAGTVAGAVMALLYVGALSVLVSPAHALHHVRDGWWWLIPLFGAFGVQIGLYVWLRRGLSLLRSGPTAGTIAVTVALAVSVLSLVAHHLSHEIFLSRSPGLTVWLARFEGSFVVLALGASALGVVKMLAAAQQAGLRPQARFLARLLHYDIRKARNVLIVLTIAGVVIAAAIR